MPPACWGSTSIAVVSSHSWWPGPSPARRASSWASSRTTLPRAWARRSSFAGLPSSSWAAWATSKGRSLGGLILGPRRDLRHRLSARRKRHQGCHRVPDPLPDSPGAAERHPGPKLQRTAHEPSGIFRALLLPWAIGTADPVQLDACSLAFAIRRTSTGFSSTPSSH